jgi:hypothetical protein
MAMLATRKIRMPRPRVNVETGDPGPVRPKTAAAKGATTPAPKKPVAAVLR